KLDNGTGLDVAVRADVVADSRGHGAKRFTLVVPIGVDDADGQLRPHLAYEAPHPQNLFGAQSQLGVRIWAHHAVRVEPGVMDAHFDQAPQPGLRRQLIDIALADAGGHARDEAIAAAILDSFETLVEDVEPAAALIADDLRPFHADERRHIPDLAKLARYLIGDELAIGKDLEIAVRMGGEDVE